MTTATVTLLENTFKILFPKGLGMYLESQSDLIAWLPKSNDFGAWEWWIAYQVNAVNGSTDFTTARANRSVPTQLRAELSRSQDHVLVSVSCEAVRASRKDEWALVSAMENSVEASVQEMTMSIEALLTGDGGGSRGQIATSGISSAVITLADTSRIVLFQPGMFLDISADNGVSAAAGVRAVALGQSPQVTAIDVSTGKITMNANVTTIWPAAADGDFIYRQGDYDAQAFRVLQGFYRWIPTGTPGTIFGMVRTSHPTALGGTRIDGDGANPLDVVKEAVQLNRRNKGKGDVLLCNTAKASEIEQFASSKQILMQEKNPKVGIGEGFKLATSGGIVEVKSFACWPENLALLTRREDWLLKSLDGFPHVVDDDGMTWHLEENSDSMQNRQRYYAQLGNYAPKNSTAITWV